MCGTYSESRRLCCLAMCGLSQEILPPGAFVSCKMGTRKRCPGYKGRLCLLRPVQASDEIEPVKHLAHSPYLINPPDSQGWWYFIPRSGAVLALLWTPFLPLQGTTIPQLSPSIFSAPTQPSIPVLQVSSHHVPLPTDKPAPPPPYTLATKGPTPPSPPPRQLCRANKDS